MLDASQLKRDPVAVKKQLSQAKDNSVIIKTQGQVLLPQPWLEKDLITMGEKTSFVGIFALVIGNVYAVSTILTLIESDPSVVSTETINGSDFYVLNYNPGDRLIMDANCVRRDGLPYKIFDSVLDRGKVPWFLTGEDLAQIYESSAPFASVGYPVDHSVFEIIMASLSRLRSDRSKFYRNGGNFDEPPVFIPFRSVQYGASNTTAKLIGAYWTEGLTSALVYPSERKEVIEDLLRA